MALLRVEDDQLIVPEEHGGSRGTSYHYVETDEGLAHIATMKGIISRVLGTSRGGRRKYCEYKVPLELVSGKHLFAFSFSNSGYFFVRRYVVTGSSVMDLGFELATEETTYLAKKFKVIGGEKPWMDLFTAYAPTMVEETKRIVSSHGAELSFLGHAARTEDQFKNPYLALMAAMSNPTWQGRQKSLEQYLQTAHELWSVAQTTEAIKGKTIEPSHNNKPFWWIEWASDHATAIQESPYGIFTLWYQFTLIPQITVVGLKIFGEVSRDVTLHVRPDIAVFKGKFERREQLTAFKPSALIIDAKLEIKDKDLEQLMGYNNVFSKHFKKCHFVVACLRQIPPYLNRRLDEIGWKGIEDVRPGSGGLAKFKEVIQSLIVNL